MITTTRVYVLVLLCTATCFAGVDLSLIPVENPVRQGDTVSIALMATNSVSGGSQEVSTVDVILHWDPGALEFTGSLNTAGAFPWSVSAFLADPDDINASLADGDAIYTALASPVEPAIVTDAGLLVTTFEFTALAITEETDILIVAEQGQFGQTKVFAPSPPQTDVLGSTADTSVMLVWPGPCICGDLDENGSLVDLNDFLSFAECFNLLPSDSQTCTCSNFVWDITIDLSDFLVFASIFSTQSTNMVPDCQ